MAERGHDKACLSTGGASHAELSVALTLISTEAEHFKVDFAEIRNTLYCTWYAILRRYDSLLCLNYRTHRHTRII